MVSIFIMKKTYEIFTFTECAHLYADLTGYSVGSGTSPAHLQGALTAAKH